MTKFFKTEVWKLQHPGGKKPFTGDNHHGLLQYKNGLIQPNFENWSTTVNSGHFPADQKQKLANTDQNKQKNLVHIRKNGVFDKYNSGISGYKKNGGISYWST